MAQTTVKSEQIATNAISGTIIADNAITGVHIAQNAILTQHIDDGQVGTSQLAADAVTGAKLADSSVVTANIQDDQVTGDKLANNIQIAGTLGVTGETTLSDSLNMGDNVRLKIGAAPDLQLWHDASNSVIKNSTGSLFLRSDGNIYLQDAGGNENFATFTDNGAVTLYYDNSAKLATSSTGVTLSGNLSMTSNVIYASQIYVNDRVGHRDDASTFIDFDTDTIKFATDGEAMRIASDGHVGIGATSPATELHVSGTNNSTGAVYTAVGAGNIPSITIANESTTDNVNAALFFRDNGDMRASIHTRFVSHAGGDQKSNLIFATAGSGNTRERMFLTEDGKLGVGTSNPSAYIQVEHDISAYNGANQWVTIRGLSGGQYIEYGSGQALSFVAVDTFPHSGASTKAKIRTTGVLEVGAGFTSGQGGNDGNNVGIKMSEYDLTINSENVTAGYVDVETNIGRASYLGCSPSIYDSTANVAKMGYRADHAFVTYADGYNNVVRVGLGGDVAAGDIVKLVVMYV